jgi:deaminated glutathione amidase
MLTLAAVQMVSTTDVTDNLAAADRLIREAVARGADLVALPEYFCLMGGADGDRLRISEPPGAGPIQTALSSAARRHGIWLVGGTVPLRTARGDRVRNASCLFAPDGSLAARYDKMHLFAYDDGSEAYDEGRVLEAGTTPIATNAGGIRLALSVCYDLRFPELFRALTFAAGERPLDLICVPSAFTHATGADHWSLLLRARAVENQCYVLAAAQGGLHADGRRTWGHSSIIDPWGDVLACVDAGEGVAVAPLDMARILAVRRKLPALQHRVL